VAAGGRISGIEPKRFFLLMVAVGGKKRKRQAAQHLCEWTEESAAVWLQGS